MMKKADIGWTLLGFAALVFCTPLGAIPAIIYGISFYSRAVARNIERGRPSCKPSTVIAAPLDSTPRGWTTWFPPTSPRSRRTGNIHRRPEDYCRGSNSTAPSIATPVTILCASEKLEAVAGDVARGLGV